MTSGLVNRNPTNRSMIVVRPSANAKPFTPPTASMYSTTAASSVTPTRPSSEYVNRWLRVALRCAEAPAWTPLAYKSLHFLVARATESLPAIRAAPTHFAIASWICGVGVVDVVLCRACATSR